MTDLLTPDLGSDRKFYLNFFKLYSLAVLLLGGAFLFGWNALNRANAEQAPEGPGTVALSLLALFLVGLAWLVWREAADRRPALEVTEKGLIDRRYGEIPWEDVKHYRMRGSFVQPCFGYDLKPGRLPPRNAWIYRWQGTVSALGGMPRRNFRKAMMVGGLEPMLLACRAVRPDLERK